MKHAVRDLDPHANHFFKGVTTDGLVSLKFGFAIACLPTLLQ